MTCLVSQYSIIKYTDFFIPETAVDIFLCYYQTTFPSATVLPKMHMLEDHIIPWLKQWKVACGLMGKQGAESLHAAFNSTERV